MGTGPSLPVEAVAAFMSRSRMTTVDPGLTLTGAPTTPSRLIASKATATGACRHLHIMIWHTERCHCGACDSHMIQFVQYSMQVIIAVSHFTIWSMLYAKILMVRWQLYHLWKWSGILALGDAFRIAGFGV